MKIALLLLAATAATALALACHRPDDHAGGAPPVSYRDSTKLRGMTLAHEGYDGHNGYGGTTVPPSLDSLARLHVNALAIVPYTFMRDPHRPTELPIPQFPGGETDAAVTAAIRQAHDRGWAVLLKPQIWIGGDHWPGDIDFATEAEWAAFFGHYTDWILHYAELAEANGVAALCVGTELVQTTLKHPEEWRRVIGRVRGSFAGEITYAANWGEEFAGLAFGDELDALGLNAYYPLSKRAEPSDAELRAGVREWLAFAEQRSRAVNRPLWLTEVGYRSATAAWADPHAAAGDRARCADCQARCYAALAEVAAESDRLTGVFWWKWPSYLGYDGGRRGQGRGYTPGGKPAAGVLADFYAHWR